MRNVADLGTEFVMMVREQAAQLWGRLWHVTDWTWGKCFH